MIYAMFVVFNTVYEMLIILYGALFKLYRVAVSPLSVSQSLNRPALR